MIIVIQDPAAMAQAMLFYYQDQTRAKEIALAGQHRAQKDLTAERHTNEFYQLYQTLLP